MNHLPPSGASQQPGQDLWQQPGAQAAGNTAWEREVLERLVLATVNAVSYTPLTLPTTLRVLLA